VVCDEGGECTGDHFISSLGFLSVKDSLLSNTTFATMPKFVKTGQNLGGWITGSGNTETTLSGGHLPPC
jgi:hypothetical protein